MDHPASFSAALTTQSAHNVRAKPAIALWVLTAAFAVIAVAVVLADATLTPEQRIAVFIQTGNFP